MIDNIKIGNNIEKGKEYNTVTTIKNELDIGTLYIPFSSISKEYESFTLADITIGSIHEYWWVDRDITEPVNFNDLDTYSHRITLIELTKILERYVIPNRSFVQLSPSKPQFTLADVIDNLIETVPFSDTINLSATRIINSVDSVLRAKAEAIIPPDIFLTGKTLKEAFVELFKIKGIDGYPRLTRDEAGNFILTADYFNELKTLIDKDAGISFKQETQASSNYATSLDITATNQIYNFNKIASSIIEPPNPSEWIGVRSDTSLLKTDQTYIELYDEIEELISVETEFVVFTQALDEEILTTDITKYVLEEDVRKGKLVAGQESLMGNGIVYQDNSISYKLGSNKIENLYELFDRSGVIDKEVIDSLYDSVAIENGFLEAKFTPTFPKASDLKFRVRYVPKINARQQVERLDLTEFSTTSTLITGQSDDFLASDRVLDSMFSRINRQGNSELSTSMFNITDINDIYTNGTYTADGYVLTNAERIAYPDHFDVKYEWTKNYQKVSEFLGLNSRPKLYEINRAAVRNEIYKEYIILDTESKSPDSYLQKLGRDVFLHTLVPNQSVTFDKPVNAIAYQSVDIPGQVVGNKALIRPCVSYAGGNSLAFWFGYKSPFNAGKQLLEEGNRTYNQFITYTDDDGRIKDFTLRYVNSYTSVPAELPEIDNPTDFATNILIDTNQLRFNKNQADITALTLQEMVFPSQDKLDTFVVGDFLLKNNNLIMFKDGVYDDLKLYLSTEIYGINENRFAKGTQSELPYTVDLTNRYLEIDNDTGADAWAIGNTNGDLYLAVNQVKRDGSFVRTNRVYFNFLKNRIPGPVIPIPDAPTELILTPSHASVDLVWSDNADDESNYVLELSLDDINWTNKITLDADSTTYTYDNLDEWTIYYFRVQAINAGGGSDYATANVRTTILPVADPSDLVLTVLDTESIQMDWTDNAINETSYKIIQYSGAVPVVVDTIAADSTTYTRIGLIPDTEYQLGIKAVSANDESNIISDFATTDPIVIEQTETPTIADISFGATSVNYTVFNNDNSTATIRSELNDSTPDTFRENVPGNTLSGLIITSGLTQNTSYTIYATAQASGETVSNVKSYGFTTDYAIPAAPTNFQVTRESANSIELTWDHTGTNLTGFDIDWSTDGSNYFHFSTEGSAARSSIDGDAPIGPTYYYRIRALNSTKSSTFVFDSTT